MSPVAEAILTSWSIDLKVALALIVSATCYLRGRRVLHGITPTRFSTWRLIAFLGGLVALWVAIASPLDTFSGLLLSAHMVQHLLLLSVAPPLILLGAPLLPLLRGLPRKFAHDGVGPFLSWPALRRFGDALTHPVICWLAMAMSLCAWHVPAAFELALRSPGWHKFEHACFFGTALMFWWPVVRPFPSRHCWPLWSVPIYLLAADLVNTLLCAVLTFSDKVLYPSYVTVPRLFGTTALSDQIAAGVIMWVPGSLVFLVPATVIAIQFLSPHESFARPARKAVRPEAFAPFDFLNVPVIGHFLRSGRRVMQAVLLLIAVAVMADGWFGPRISAMNLAGVLPWTYWRALTVVVLLVAGNFFCMACPFMLPRELGKHLNLKPRVWPRTLRSKWFAIGLLILFFWSYETFGLWDKPAWTAWTILGYFVAAFFVDAFFRGASFCKYVCPIGQFHFVTSLISPLEVKVREPTVCSSCKTHDCLRGNEHHRGCETQLYLPKKAGNMDCTFCLDCVRACPHDNIGLQIVAPGSNLIRDPRRSTLGRLSQRMDVATAALVLVFAAFANAAAMVAPMVAWSLPLITLLFFITLVVAPAIMHVTTPARELFCRFSLALVPLGAAMWAAHFLFHLLVDYCAAVPVLQRASGGWFGKPDWSPVGMSGDSILALQTLLLDAGLLLTLYIGWRVARECSVRFRVVVPWICVVMVLYAGGVWVFLQPMQMRGMLEAML